MIQSFTDLIVWQKGHKLVLSVYSSTKAFPIKETFSLVDQMRRCAISITSNIAEGFNRRTKKEKIQFYYMALGSLTELQNQLLVSRDVGYLPNDTFKELAEKTVEVNKLLHGLMRTTNDRN